MAACDLQVQMPSSSLCLESHRRKVSRHIVRALKEPWGNVAVVRNRGLQPTARWVSLPGRLTPLSHVTNSDKSAEALGSSPVSVFGT